MIDTTGTSLRAPVARFADTLEARFATTDPAEPEAQLSGPFETLLTEAAAGIGIELLLQPQSRAVGRLGVPDYGVVRARALVGFAELKAPGTGADVRRFKGRNRHQWDRFRSLPNVVYTDGEEWALYQSGELVGDVVRLGPLTRSGGAALDEGALAKLVDLLRRFLGWQPIVPRSPKALAQLLAPACRVLRDEVLESLADEEAPLRRLAADWRQLLFPGIDDRDFADAYAQTVTYGLLLARTRGTAFDDLVGAVSSLQRPNAVMAKALQVMTDPAVLDDLRPALTLLLRLINAVEPAAFRDPKRRDPWLYFYEDFLAAYDPDRRRDAGVYYTPAEVVHAQVRLVDDVLGRLGYRLGLAEDVVVLDPAVGTGTYMIGVIQHALDRVEREEGAGALAARASMLGKQVHGFELLVGPYAVAQLRVTEALTERTTNDKNAMASVYLTNTLESPFAEPPMHPLFYEPLAREHKRALKVKKDESIVVVLGNPPYDRHAAATKENRALAGGWVRFGDPHTHAPPLLEDVLAPVRDAGDGVHLKNVYNLYVYFWRWAIWKAMEADRLDDDPGHERPGLVSFITASSYLDGPAFAGLRQLMRARFEDLWILDLGGDQRGAAVDENVFAIQTPVAIAMGVGRRGRLRPPGAVARVHYHRVTGDRATKLAFLDGIRSLADVPWTSVEGEGGAPFVPRVEDPYFTWPRLFDLMPWQASGVELKRTWPIGPTPEVLERRWRRLMASTDRASVIRETEARNAQQVVGRVPGLEEPGPSRISLAAETAGAPLPGLAQLAFRSYDRQWVIADARLGDRWRPQLWRAHSDRQVYLSTTTGMALTTGPAVTMSAFVPDRHHFRGSYGGKGVIPLFLDEAATTTNVASALVAELRACGVTVNHAGEVFAAITAIMSAPAFTRRLGHQLASRDLRVPVPLTADVFRRLVDLGRSVIAWSTFGERCSERLPNGRLTGSVRNTLAVSEGASGYPDGFTYDPVGRRLTVGTGTFEPVAPDVMAFEVSGFKVVESYLRYRMKRPKGKKSSPLDDIGPETWDATATRGLLEVLWVVEGLVALGPELDAALDDVLAGPLLLAQDLPEPTEAERRGPGAPSGGGAQPLLIEW